MPIVNQLAGSLNLAFHQGDDFGSLIDLSIDTTGYQLEAAIVSLVTGEELLTVTLEEVDAEAGQWQLSLTGEQTAELPVGSLGLRVSWLTEGGMVRRFLEGICEVVK